MSNQRPENPGIFRPERDITKHGVVLWSLFGLMVLSLLITYVAWSLSQ